MSNEQLPSGYLDDLRKLNRHDYFAQLYGRFDPPKRCPFCNSSETRMTGSVSNGIAVRCCECLASGPVAHRSQGDGKRLGDVQNDAIDLWNKCRRTGSEAKA
jgi:hypothetical protein